LEEAGIVVSKSPSLIGKHMLEQMKKAGLAWSLLIVKTILYLHPHHKYKQEAT
jgi:hypothetical protein